MVIIKLVIKLNWLLVILINTNSYRPNVRSRNFYELIEKSDKFIIIAIFKFFFILKEKWNYTIRMNQSNEIKLFEMLFES